jgi:SAM-dependent methyltransferase
MTVESNVGKWDFVYKDATFVQPYGDSPVYEMGAVALRDAGCTRVEDWGCGYGWFAHIARSAAPTITVVGVDGSQSPTAAFQDDLVTRQTSVDGIFMRSVLEHNYNWPDLLTNALGSFTKRMVLATFTKFQTTGLKDKELRFEDEYQVPTLSLSYPKLLRLLKGFRVVEQEIVSPNTYYDVENIFVIDRADG